MLFNSFEFAFFLPIVFFIYWYIVGSNIKIQNLFLLGASYFFYGWWNWKFLSLIVISSSVDYIIGIYIGKYEKQKIRKLLLLLSITVNLGILGLFKYYNFFVESFIDAFTLFGQTLSPTRIEVILPVGISFYTFQTLSYTIDVYKKKLNPTNDIISFFAYICFFPQLVAGPIERAKNLLPQFFKKRKFEYHIAADGMRQILWGLFKKIVIADNCAIYADDIFLNYTDYSGSTLFFGAFFFTLQIYCDFSGYSDIAIGTAKLFGFKLMKNFAFPYFSRDIAEFWRRWHISLSTWFRDYVYIPLGGSRVGNIKKIRNIFIIFILSGFWHGANWTFIAWGTLNALYFLPLLLLNRNRTYLDNILPEKFFPDLKNIYRIGTTFFLTIVAWIFFRAQDISHAIKYLHSMFSESLFSIPHIKFKILYLISFFIIVEWLQRNKEHALSFKNLKMPAFLRYLYYHIIIVLIIIYGAQKQQFIYFQF